ncbi:MAG: family 78 glycoside hydrolase catalytic domain [Phycisphaeraceae bacterium]|nr:family 78 glycoside hydrolase catalytic domain [Phycisphaeraceae bacterium]
MAMLYPEGLLCEYAVNPLGIDVTRPRLSWRLEADAEGSRKAPVQTAYRVRVASSEEQLIQAIEGGKADLWDSGIVRSGQTLHVEYAGRKLRSGQRCWWSVEVWADEQEASALSWPAWWEMGLLDPAKDWHGPWIGRTETIEYEPAPFFRREVELPAEIATARLYICGLGYHELSINGWKVGGHALDPTWTMYHKRVLYVTHDVTELLRPGSNAIGVVLGTGWYNCHAKAVWGFDKAPWRAAPALRLELRVTLEDGREMVVASGPEWRTTTGPIVEDSIYTGETYDARLEMPGWDQPGFDDSQWQAAKVVAGPAGRLAAQQMPAVEPGKAIRPVRVWESSKGVYVVDAGQNLAGRARLKVRGKRGTKIVMKYAETLKPDGSADVDGNAGLIKRAGFSDKFQTDTYICKGEGVETWESRFTYHGFQYVEVAGFPGKLKASDISIIPLHTRQERVGTFRSSNRVLNRLWAMTRWSYLSNLVGVPTDCPQREKNGWTGDAQLAAEQAIYNHDPALVYTNWLEDYRDSQLADGRLPGIVPTSGHFGYDGEYGPGWDSAYVMMPWHMYLYYGDRRILARHYPGMKKYVAYLNKRASKGVLRYGLGDWLPPIHDRCIPVTSTAMYYDVAKKVAAIAGILGKETEATKYEALAAKVREAFYREMFNVKKGFCGNNYQTDFAAVLYHGILKEEDRPKVLGNLLQMIKAHGGHLATGILGARAMLNVLLDHGRTDVAYAMVTKPDYPGWGYWVSRGATTLWETWDGVDVSQNHIMFGEVSAWFYKALAGIRVDPQQPAFEHVVIRPQVVGDLRHVSASTRTLRGVVSSAWERKGGKLTLQVEIPPTATGTVCVPWASKGKAPGRPSRMETDASGRTVAVYEVGPGVHRFVGSL